MQWKDRLDHSAFFCIATRFEEYEEICMGQHLSESESQNCIFHAGYVQDSTVSHCVKLFISHCHLLHQSLQMQTQCTATFSFAEQGNKERISGRNVGKNIPMIPIQSLSSHSWQSWFLTAIIMKEVFKVIAEHDYEIPHLALCMYLRTWQVLFWIMKVVLNQPILCAKTSGGSFSL